MSSEHVNETNIFAQKMTENFHFKEPTQISEPNLQEERFNNIYSFFKENSENVIT